MSFLSRFFSRQKEASAPILSGAPMVRFYQPMGYIERQITPELIAADRSVLVVLSSLVGLNRLCFGGFDHNLKPIDEGDDTQGPKIDTALKQIKLQEKRIGRVGKVRKTGTLGLIRASALDGWSFRQALSEYSTIQEGSWLNFAEIQSLPAQSFGAAATGLSGAKILPDKILPGIVYDGNQDRTRFFQSSTSYGQAKELDPEQILYIEDIAVPPDISYMKALVPVIEQWKEIRRYGMTAERRVAVPNETAAVDAKDIVALSTIKGFNVNVQAILDYAKDLCENQSSSNEKVVIPGLKLQYPNISMPLNPWEADADLRKQIVDFFFHRDILEVTAQAFSASNAPAKDLLDLHIASERELWGKPYEGLWNQWLEWNGFELVDEFVWWSWSPKDQKAEHQKNLENYRSHAITINEFRKLEGLSALTEEEIAALAKEHALIFGNKSNIMNPSDTTV
jgi:hypothetical protein